jgi:hypothetical protein
MNPSDFQQAREARLKAFDEKYKVAKQAYADALQKAMSEQDRSSQCVLIKNALDKNKELTQLVGEMLTPSGSSGCKLTADKIRSLRTDVDNYTKQYEEIRQGRDRIHSLQMAYANVENRVNVLHGLETIYIVLLALVSILLVILVFHSGISSIFNTKSVASVVPGGLT